MQNSQPAPKSPALQRHRVLDRTLAHWQRQSLKGLGGIAQEFTPGETVYLSPQFGAKLKATQCPLQARYDVYLSEKTAFFSPLHGPRDRFQLALGNGAAPAAALHFRQIDACDFDVRPYGTAPHRLQLPVYDAWAISIDHWWQLLDVNLMALAAQKKELGLRETNQIHPNVKIHPTAYVVGSVLERGAIVEPFASVINAHLGEEARVAANSLLHHTVLGAGSQTLVDSHLRRVVVGQNSTVANLGLWDSLIGDDCFVTTAVGVFGQKPFHNVELAGQTIHRPVLGIGVGHGTVLGARALFEAGVYVPDRTLVVGRPDEAAAKLDQAHLKRAKMQVGDPRNHF